jgi:Colicin D
MARVAKHRSVAISILVALLVAFLAPEALTPAEEAAQMGLRPVGGGAPSPSEGITFAERQLQAKFKHAPDFGVTSNWSASSGADYAQALRDFADAPGTTMIQGTYRGGAANLFVDPEYGRLLVTDPQGGFWTAFGNLSPAKIESIVLRGAG